MGPVKVVASPEGDVIKTSERNPEYGSIRLEQETVNFNDKGFVNGNKRVTFLKGEITFLQKLGYRDGQELKGRIIVRESFDPPNTKDEMMGLKRAFKDGPICRYENHPIYRTTFYTEDERLQDEFIKHTNTAEIKAAMLLRDQLHIELQ